MLEDMDNGYYDGSAYDAETVRFFDVAHEGSQIRLLANSLEALWPISGMRPRSVVILATEQVARAAADFVVGLAEPLRVPIVVAEALPQFVGALDIVVVVGDKGECDWASQALISADKRGATTIFIGPSSGPLVDDVPASTVVAPTLPTAAGPSPARCIAALYAIVEVLEGDCEFIARRLEEVASAVDRELVLLSPESDSTTNPGRQLREFVEGCLVIHSCGVDPHAYSSQRQRVDMGCLVARMAASVWATRGLGGTFVAAEELPQVLERRNTGGDNVNEDLFFDPFLDSAQGQGALVPLKVVLWVQDEANLSHSLAVNSADPEPGLGDLARALQLITRSYAATAYDIN